MRDSFIEAGVLVCNLVSSPGTGKTTLLQETLRRLVLDGERVAAVVGDLETDNSADWGMIAEEKSHSRRRRRQKQRRRGSGGNGSVQALIALFTIQG